MEAEEEILGEPAQETMTIDWVANFAVCRKCVGSLTHLLVHCIYGTGWIQYKTGYLG